MLVWVLIFLMDGCLAPSCPEHLLLQGGDVVVDMGSKRTTQMSGYVLEVTLGVWYSKCYRIRPSGLVRSV